MKKISFALVAFSFILTCFASCGSGDSAAVAETKQWADKLCQCKDKACGEAITAEATHALSKYRNDEKLSKADRKGMRTAMDRAKACGKKLK